MINCCNPIQEPFEFEISDNSYINNVVDISFDGKCCCCSDNSLYELKQKVICEFQQIIDQLECGIQPDLELLLQEISLIYIHD